VTVPRRTHREHDVSFRRSRGSGAMSRSNARCAAFCAISWSAQPIGVDFREPGDELLCHM